MKQLKEQEQNRLRDKYSRWQQREIKRADESMMKSIKQIKCRRLQFCRDGDTKVCFACKYNVASTVIPKIDYYKPKIPGMKFLGDDI